MPEGVPSCYCSKSPAEVHPTPRAVPTNLFLTCGSTDQHRLCHPGQPALVQQQFETFLRLPLAQPLFNSRGLLQPLALVRGHTIDILRRGDDVRRQENQQVRLDLGRRGLFEGPPEERNTPQTGNLALGLVDVITNEATNHNGLIVVDNHRGFRLARGGDRRAKHRFFDHRLDFLIQLQTYRFALTDLRGDGQLDTDIFEVKGPYL